MSQTSYSQNGAASFRGMLDGVGAHNIRSYAAQGAVAVGAPVKLGTDAAKSVLTTTTGALTIGFAVHDHARVQSAAGVVEYADDDAVSVLTQGRFWALTSDAVVAGATANLTLADGTLTDAAVAGGIEAFTQITVKFVTATTAAGLAIVEIK
jgi:hypothetical protein